MTQPYAARRTVLATGAVASVTGLGALDRQAAAAPAGRRTFRHGVASGDPLPTAVVLWTRVTPTREATPGSGRGPRVRVRWEVAADRAFERVVRSGTVETGAWRDHTVKVDATGLEPGRWYHYRFRSGGETSPVGRTRTAPAHDEEVDRLRAGVVSCSNWQAGHFAAYRHLAERPDLDLVVHLGDYFYEGGPGEESLRDHLPAHEVVTLADYRQRHAQYKTDPDLQRLHARLPWVVTWDDHEVTNDAWRDGAENHQPDEGDYAARRARAHRAYDEWMPVRLDGTARLGDGTRLFRSLRWGTLADLTMLDLRTYRDQQVRTALPFPVPASEAETADPDRTLTGPEQMAWLKDTLSASRARWRLVGNPVMVVPLSMAQLPADAVDAVNAVAGVLPRDGAPFNVDQWDGYTDDRRELVAHLVEEGIQDTVFLTGDIHSAWAAELPVDAGSYPVTGTAGVELVCTSVTSTNLDEQLGVEPRTASLAIERTLLANNRHIKYLDFDSHGFSVLDVSPERAQMDWWVVEDRTRADSGAAWSVSWATPAGSGSVHQVDQPTG